MATSFGLNYSAIMLRGGLLQRASRRTILYNETGDTQNCWNGPSPAKARPAISYFVIKKKGLYRPQRPYIETHKTP